MLFLLALHTYTQILLTIFRKNRIRKSQIQRIKKLSTVELDKTKGSCKSQQKIVKVATKTGYLSFDSFFSISSNFFGRQCWYSWESRRCHTDIETKKTSVGQPKSIEMPKPKSIRESVKRNG